VSKEADIVRAAEALKAIKALVESNQDDNIAPDADILTLDSVVWRSPSTPVIDPVAQNAALSPPSNPEQTIVALANAAEIFAQSPVPQPEQMQAGQLQPKQPQPEQPQEDGKVAPQPAHMESDPYSIFELGEPVLRDRLETEPTASQGLPPEQSEVMAVQAARQLQYEKIMQERARQKALAPSPHLQPTAPRPAPQDNAADGGNFADFTVDEHEAMMSTPLGRLDLTASSATEPSIDTAIEQAATEQAAIEQAQAQAQPTPAPEVQPEKASPKAVEPPVEAPATPTAPSAPSPAKAAAKAQIPLHIVTDNGVEEGDESNPQDVMRNALRSMIREQIGTWVQDNIGSLIEDALREPPRERKNTPHRNNLNKD